MSRLVSIVENLATIRAARTIKAIYIAIIGTVFKIQTSIIREHLSKGDIDKFNAEKKKLYAATFSCRLEGGRKAENIIEYTRFLCLDFDHIPTPEDVEHCRKVINSIPYTRLSFVSPSGLGLKVIVEVSSDIIHHKAVYLQAAKYYEDEIGFPADKNTSDVNRMCFLPHDDKAYLNEESEVFMYQEGEMKIKNVIRSNGECQSVEVFEHAISFTENKKRFVQGERNSFLFLLASNCNRYGLCKDFVTDMCIERFADADFDAKEIRDCVASSYRNESAYNTWTIPSERKWQPHSSSPSINVQESNESSTPFFEEYVHDNLPPLIRDTAELFSDQRSRDIYVLTYLTVLSGYAYLSSGWYFQSKVRPNMFSFVVANPASGKSAMSKVEELFKELERGHKPSPVTMETPKNTFKSLVKQLSKNNGLGILYDDEVEVFGRMFKHDKVSINFFFKKGYDNREISASGKEKTTEFIISEPKFSFITGGNLDQISRLINTATDGTRSRLNVYCFGEATPILNPRPGGWKDFANQKEAYLERLASFIRHIEQHPFEFKLTDDQFSRIKEEAEALVNGYNAKSDIAMNGVIKRAGVTIFRIATVLSCYRRFEEGNIELEYTCSDIDFKVALSMAKTLVAHSHFAGEVLKKDPSAGLQTSIQVRQNQILNAMPECFSRNEALAAVKKMGLKISDRTLDNDLKRMHTSGLVGHSHDKYCKQAA